MNDSITLARNYLAKSNRGNLEELTACFDPEAVYHSTQLGWFRGRTEIHTMMESFYHRFSNPQWTAGPLQQSHDDTVEFSFTMTATGSDNLPVRREGREKLRFNLKTGLITAVEVEVISTGTRC